MEWSFIVKVAYGNNVLLGSKFFILQSNGVQIGINKNNIPNAIPPQSMLKL